MIKYLMRILIICAFILFGLSNSSKSFDTDSKCNVTSVRTQDSCFYDFPNYQFSAIVQPEFERQDIWSFKEPNIFDSFAGDAIVLSVSNIRCQEFPLILKFISNFQDVLYSNGRKLYTLLKERVQYLSIQKMTFRYFIYALRRILI